MDTNIKARVKETISKLPEFTDELNFAERYMKKDPHGSLTKSRTVLEKVVLRIFKLEMGTEPKKPELGMMLNNNQFTRKFDNRIAVLMNSVRAIANLGAHGGNASFEDAFRVLSTLCDILDWYIDNYMTGHYTSQLEKNKKHTRLFYLFIIGGLLAIASVAFFYLNGKEEPDTNDKKTTSSSEKPNTNTQKVATATVASNKESKPLTAFIDERHWNGFTITLKSCSKTSAKIQCKMSITANKDTVINLHRETAVFDNKGNKSDVATVQYGSSSATTILSFHHYIYKELISGITVNAIISFHLIDQDASSISAFKLTLSQAEITGRKGNKETLTFRDIAL